MKRLCALLLVCAMLLGLVPTAFAANETAEPTVYTEEDYVTADLLWEGIHDTREKMEDLKATTEKTTEAIISVITSSPYYAEDTLIRNGNHIFWETIDGIPCGYSPRLAEISENATPMEGYDPATAETVITTSYATKGGYPGSKDVYLIQPYYGIDEAFTEQYETEANVIAAATGGTVTIYRTTGATIDAVADAVENGAVVLFDSHGTTDYSNPNDSEDDVSEANTSYFCLQVGTGLTSDDYTKGTGKFGEYYHAFYYGSNGNLKYYCVDGTAIANHMESNSPNGLLWIAICLGMATDGLHAPLLAKGAEVAYGYSQSVTFNYDYKWEKAFWSQMILGKTVAESISYMKIQVGHWDWCHSSLYNTIENARAGYCAFPIVVSSEDPYPGHGNVDDYQTVNSTWALMADCPHTAVTYTPATPATCLEKGNIAYYQCNHCNALFTDQALTVRINSADIVVAAKGHSYDSGELLTTVGCMVDGITRYTCLECGHIYEEVQTHTGHNFVNDICANCGVDKPPFVPFAYGQSGTFVLAAKINGEYYALPNTDVNASQKLKAIMVDGSYGYVDSKEAQDVALELIYNEDKDTYYIFNGTYYLYYPSSTNIGGQTTPYAWTLKAGINGSWAFVAQQISRHISYRTNGFNYFGCYYDVNISSGSKEYFHLEILPVVTIACEHTMDDGKITTEPTCTVPGVKTFTCTKCGETTKEELPATGHNWDEGTVTTEPTCIGYGVKIYTCGNCSATKTEQVPSTGVHTYVSGICTNCGEAEPTEPTEPEPTEPSEPTLDETIVINHTLNLASDISINYAVRSDLLLNFDSYYLSCVIPVYSGNEIVQERTVTIRPVYKGNYYYFTLKGITAVQMADEIKATLHLTKGKNTFISGTDIYSISTYAYTQLSRPVPDTLKKLCAELLRYGATAQGYKGYRTDCLADRNMTDTDRSYLGNLDEVPFGDNNRILDDVSQPTVTWAGKTLNLDSTITVKFIVDLSAYEGDPQQLELHYSYETCLGETNTAILLRPVLYYPEKNYYAFEVDELLASEFRTVITAAVYCNEVQVSPTTVYSADSYGNGKEERLTVLCKTLLSYSDTALAFFRENMEEGN